MKRFDFNALRERYMARARVKLEWAQIVQDGVISNVLDVIAEGNAELARYMEYLLGEKKWDTAQNTESLVKMAKLISRKPTRPVSSAGFVIVSHTDSNGTDRLANYGRSFFALDDPSDYDNITQKTNYTVSESSALIPWTNPSIYVIPKGTIFTSDSGIQFISTKAVYSRYLSIPYSQIKNDATKYAAFIQAGGWDGIKYVRVPVIQGTQKEVVLGKSDGSKYESFTLAASNVEAAANSLSEDFFYVEVIDNAGNSERWEECANIELAGPYDKVFEATTTDDGSGLIIKFGNGISGKQLTSGNQVKIHYLETLGEAGNVSSKFSINTMAFPNNISMVDPRTNVVSTFLSCTNDVAIKGGKNMESDEEFRENAPTSYVKSYATATKKEYEEKIMKYSPVSLLKLRVFPSAEFSTNVFDVSIDDNYAEVSNEYTTIKNVLNVTAIQSNGEKIEDATNTFINPILESLANIKGPNDSLEYCEPNFIQMAAGVIISTKSTAYSDSEVATDVKNAILNDYSIFNTEFREPLYKSVIVADSKNFEFSDAVSVELEALATIDWDKLDIVNMSTTGTNYYTSVSNKLVDIPFHFDKLFAQNQYLAGFRNYESNSGYLLKANLKFNSAAMSSYNRTLFLFDNRLSNIDIQQAKSSIINSNLNMPANTKTIELSNGNTISFFDETSDYFDNRQSRVAQFPFITNVTSDTFMMNAKKFTVQPFEIRPYVVDTDGKNKVFSTDDVAENRISIGGSEGEIGTTCYQGNPNYIENIDILFTEDYDNVSSENFAKGHLLIPLTYFGYNSASNLDFTDASIYDQVADEIKSKMSIKVFARPRMEDFSPTAWNDIIFIDDDDIKVEKNYIGASN